jgi:sugar lactone lactonase YvrE
MELELELLAWGFGLVEGPRTDAKGTLYFTDATKGGVFCRNLDGTIRSLVPGRMMVGGLALHVDGGLVLSGPDVVHWKDGDVRVLLRDDSVPHWNDLHPDTRGRIVVGSMRFDPMDRNAVPVPGECYRIELDGSTVVLYDGVDASNGLGFSPDGRTLYHVDSASKGLWMHDVAEDGTASNRRHIGRDAFARGLPDGMCVDAEGALWVAHVGGRRVVKLDPTGGVIGEIPVPAKMVTSVAFGGPDHDEMYIVTADNLDDPAKGGSIFRTRPGVAGVPTALVQV